MKVINKETGAEAGFVRHNHVGIGEFIAVFPDGSMSSEYLRDWRPADGGPWPDEEGNRYPNGRIPS